MNSTLPRFSSRALCISFAAAVLAFAWWRFSENTADNDLWGHVLYGQRNLTLHQLTATETLSYTARGAHWVNHEYLAEIAMGLVHRIAGGTGLWLMMLGLAGLTLLIALRASVRAGGATCWVALSLFAASTMFIASGYAVRPQLFTMLAFVVELWILRKLAEGSRRLGWWLPPLFAVWVNTHGGYLAGALILAVATFAVTIERVLRRARVDRGGDAVVRRFWWASIGSACALLLNPEGARLITWTIATVQLPRPYISEWHPTPLDPAHAAFWIVLAISAAAWLASRGPRATWQMAVLVLLAVMGILQRRHLPLFGLANLLFTPAHLVSALARIRPHCDFIVRTFSRATVQLVTAGALLAGSGACVAKSLSAPKEHPFTIEVERDVFPLAAIDFMRREHVDGDTLVFFDWGQQVLWELPNNPVSFDGRLDTVYSPGVMNAHWDFYAGRGVTPELKLHDADVALLLSASASAATLESLGWTAIYRDFLATVLIPKSGRHAARFAGRKISTSPLSEVKGRTPFPNALPLLGTRAAPR